LTDRQRLRLTVAMRQAEALAVLGTCPRKQVGCVILDADFTVIASGYNGAGRGLPHCGCTLVKIDGRDSCARAVHAEHNAILTAARHGRRLDGAIAVSTMRPCERCAIALYQAGVVACWYGEEYEGRSAMVEELVANGWICERLAS
jgi:dCMP deaminase